MTIDAASSLNGAFALSGGTLTGAGDVTLNGAMTWTGGAMSGTGRTIIDPAGTLTISGSPGKTLGRLLENHSPNVTWTGGQITFNNGTLNNESDGTFIANLASSLSFASAGGTNAVNNAGTFNKTGAGTLTVNSGVPFNNTGTVNVDAGGLTLAGGGMNIATIDADSGTTLTFPASYTHGSTSSLSGQGELTFSGGTHTLRGALDTDRVITVGIPSIIGATVNCDVPYTFTGTLNLSGFGAVLAGPSNITVAGTFNWTSGSMSGSGRTIIGAGGSMTISDATLGKTLGRRLENHSPNASCTVTIAFNNGTFSNESDGTLAADLTGSQFFLVGGGTNAIDNAGTFIKTGAWTLTVNSGIPFSNPGTIHVQAGMLSLAGGLTNGAGTTLTGGTYVVSGTLQYPSADIVTNAASIILDGPASAIESTTAVDALANFANNSAAGSFQITNGRNYTVISTFVNQGQMSIGPGASTLSAVSTYVQSSGATTLDGGTLDPEDLADIRGGDLKGNGQVLGSVENAGTLKPGLSPGGMVITGDYTQTVQGAFEAEIGGTAAGTEYDRLTVDGRAVLAGALNVTLVGGFVPSIDDTFDILTADAVTVKFATIEMPLLPDLMGWQFDDLPDALSFRVIDCGPGDADGDGVGDACETAPDLSWHTIDGGGATFSSGSEFKLGATIGQPDAGVLTGGEFELIGGFWAAALPGTPLPGDLDGDGDVDLEDFEVFSGCLSGPGIEPGIDCGGADLDGDGDVDVLDFADLQVAFE